MLIDQDVQGVEVPVTDHVRSRHGGVFVEPSGDLREPCAGGLARHCVDAYPERVLKGSTFGHRVGECHSKRTWADGVELRGDVGEHLR